MIKQKKNFFKAKSEVVEVVTFLPNCTKLDSYQTRVKGTLNVESTLQM